jgi:hypothetical protein
MEAGMRALAAAALVFGSIIAATTASATVYVPGQYKNGIYIRPHFLDSPDQVYGGPPLLPPDPAAIKAKEGAPNPVMLEPQAVPQKRRGLPAS